MKSSYRKEESMRRALWAIPVALSIAALCFGCRSFSGAERQDARTFTLWQLPNQTPSQMMSYVIRTVHGRLIVIDGGRDGDAPYLTAFLKDLGGRVEAWFITHPHGDHCDALREILGNPQDLAIGPIYASMPDPAWLAETSRDDSEKRTLADLLAALKQTKRALVDVSLGQEFRIDGLRIEILGIRNPEIRVNPVNNSCMVLRTSDKRKSVLFLADSGPEAGDKLLAGPYAKRLHADYVQMAHHGQKGVGEAVYQAIHPSYCLWPTPKWLWDNDPGSGKGTGHWKTLEVRAWMERFPVKKHYLLFDGLQKIE